MLRDSSGKSGPAGADVFLCKEFFHVKSGTAIASEKVEHPNTVLLCPATDYRRQATLKIRLKDAGR